MNLGRRLDLVLAFFRGEKQIRVLVALPWPHEQDSTVGDLVPGAAAGEVHLPGGAAFQPGRGVHLPGGAAFQPGPYHEKCQYLLT